ncbi:glycoside hydrolase family 30 protein [Parapedobacter indicus]|uniref:Glucosylceramidase n=1 Tax=Parapedobacter indicus TaxID=1477437 RepID=A0A1I3JZL0_9SPHI|nr:glycoside hydrolase family 30 beta sandwich domain-containing protein [Parapedobacter indicus]PPL01665.1 glucosylceramidase [Parapedobacter indicus]SFI65691.1 glucosylceramidase [Parapedobacter indicus]
MNSQLFYHHIAKLMLVCFLFATCSSNNNSTPEPEPAPPVTDGDVKVLVTTADLSQDLKWQTVDYGESSNMSPTTITLDPTQRYQEMDGFGAAITGSTSYNLMQMNTEDRAKFLKETFSESEGYGHSYIRIAIGCSDFSLSEYSLCDNPGIENFALQSEERDYVIPILKEILAINPSIKIIGSPWTPPRWMKVNNLTDRQPHNAWTSGHLNPAYYSDYGLYFVKWIQALESEGIPIYAVTPQNEPLNRGNSASLFMGWQEQQAFIKEGLGPRLRDAGLETKIYVFDHNYNYDNMADQYDYPVKIYQDEAAASFVAGAAYHNYGGNRQELLDIRQQRPDKELIFTETSIGTWNDGRNLTTRLMDDMEEVALGTVNNWCRAVIVWNLMLDSDRGPNRDGGCQTCYGAVDINKNDYKTIRRNSHYYIISHLSAVVKPGATRIGTSGYTAAGVMYAAFENPDSSYAAVLLNNTDEKKRIVLADGTHHFSYEVPAKSVVSYRWN